MKDLYKRVISTKFLNKKRCVSRETHLFLFNHYKIIYIDYIDYIDYLVYADNFLLAAFNVLLFCLGIRITYSINISSSIRLV